MTMKPTNSDLVAVLEGGLADFRRAAARKDRAAMSGCAETLSRLALGVAEHLDPSPKPQEGDLVAMKEGCVGHGIAPFTPEENAAASTLLTVLMLGLDHAIAIHRFKDWLKHAPPEDLEGDVTEVRLKYFDQCAWHYIPKTTAARTLVEHKARR
jgi:hypothetical protein